MASEASTRGLRPPTEKGRERLSVVIPALGEASNLRLLLPRIQAVARTLGPEVEILVIDAQNSLDTTPEVCAENEVKCIPRRGSDRYGDAIRTGIRSSTGDYVAIMDADGSHDPEFIAELWRRRSDAEVVIASRYVPGGQTDNPRVLVAMSRLLNTAFKAIVGMPVLDASNSFRLYRGSILRALVLSSLHFDIQEEILVRLINRDPTQPARILEIPFHFRCRVHGKPKRRLLSFGVAFALGLVRFRRLLRGGARQLREGGNAPSSE